LITANFGLLPHGTSDDELKAFEDAFGIRKLNSGAQPDQYPWVETATQWYVVARWVSALDNLIIAFLKPAISSGDTVGEGELVAPFVTALATRIETQLIDARLPVEPDLMKASRLTGAFRDVLRNSPLMATSIVEAPFIGALRHVYGLSAPPETLDESGLVTALLEAFPMGTSVSQQHATYLNSLVGKSGPVISRKLMELEQTLHDEVGTEAAIMRLIETVETMADGSSPPANKRFPALLADAITTGMNAVDKTKSMPPVQLAVDMAWADYRTVLKGNFNGAEATRRAVEHTFVRDLLTYVEANPPKKKPRRLLGYLLKLLRTSSFYEARFFEKPKPIPGFGTTVLRPEIARLPVVTQFPLRLQLRRAFWNAIQPLYAFNDPNARFIPDSAPHPIPSQIAATIDGSRIDNFGKHLNGIAVAIQRSGPGTDVLGAILRCCRQQAMAAVPCSSSTRASRLRTGRSKPASPTTTPSQASRCNARSTGTIRMPHSRSMTSREFLASPTAAASRLSAS